MKRFYMLLPALCLTLALAVTASAAEETAFSDVPAGAPYAEAVRWAAERGYINGYQDGRFGVNGSVTRAQLSAILYRAAGSPAASGTSRFSDVAAGAYYVQAASWTADNGLINGYAGGRFGVGDPVTRQQAAAIFWRWAGSPNASAADYADESAIAAYAGTAVDWIRSNNMMAARSGGHFDPAAPATRVEIVSALYQYLSSDHKTPNTNESYVPLPEETAAANTVEGENSTLNLTVNGTTLTAALADNSSARALAALLADGPRTIEMSDYGSMEKVGPLGQNLPTNNEQITTQAGDLILYQGSQFVIYYAPNSWNFTRLGQIQDVSAAELRNLLGSGDVSVTLSLV